MRDPVLHFSPSRVPRARMDAGDVGAKHLTPPHPPSAVETTWRAAQCVATTKPIRGHLTGYMSLVQPREGHTVTS